MKRGKKLIVATLYPADFQLDALIFPFISLRFKLNEIMIYSAPGDDSSFLRLLLNFSVFQHLTVTDYE